MQRTKVSLEEFEHLIALPENEDRLFELIDGEMIEVSPGRTRNSGFSYLIAFRVQLFCHERGIPCYISGEAGAYRIGDHVVAPDLAYKPTPLSDNYPDPDPPLWVVEIISPTDKATDIRDKRQIYIDAGILYWEFYPDRRSIDVYAPGQPLL